MKGIRRRGKKWLVDVTVQGKRRTATCDSYDQAVARRYELLSGAQQAHSGQRAWTLGEAYRRTKDREWKGTRSESKAVANAKQAVDFFGWDTRLDSITTDSVDQYVEHMEGLGSSNATINRKLAALSKMFTVAHRRGGVGIKPHFPRKREAQGRIRFLTQEEERALLRTMEHFGKEEHRDACIVLIDTGLRCGELWRLTAGDVTLSTDMLHVWETKADLPRSVPMTARVKGIIRPKVHGASRGDRLFPYDNWWMRSAWERVRSHLGHAEDPQFVPHMLRHTCASRLVQRGVALKVVQEWLGHKTISQTMRYAHLAPATLSDAAKVLETDQKEAV